MLRKKPSYIRDPIHGSIIVYPKELSPVLQELASTFSVAIGLAMRDIK